MTVPADRVAVSGAGTAGRQNGTRLTATYSFGQHARNAPNLRFLPQTASPFFSPSLIGITFS